MSEPRREPTTLSTEPHTDTDKLSLLFGSKVWDRLPYEQSQKLTEQVRRALIIVQDVQGQQSQFAIVATLNYENKAVQISIGPTNGAIKSHPELATVSFSATAYSNGSLVEPLRQAMEKMTIQQYQSPELAGYLAAA